MTNVTPRRTNRVTRIDVRRDPAFADNDALSLLPGGDLDVALVQLDGALTNAFHE